MTSETMTIYTKEARSHRRVSDNADIDFENFDFNEEERISRERILSLEIGDIIYLTRIDNVNVDNPLKVEIVDVLWSRNSFNLDRTPMPMGRYDILLKVKGVESGRLMLVNFCSSLYDDNRYNFMTSAEYEERLKLKSKLETNMRSTKKYDTGGISLNEAAKQIRHASEMIAQLNYNPQAMSVDDMTEILDQKVTDYFVDHIQPKLIAKALRGQYIYTYTQGINKPSAHAVKKTAKKLGYKTSVVYERYVFFGNSVQIGIAKERELW